MSAAATHAGVILGTAAYMSPKQAKGKTADARSDIWAFGVVLFEMLTGTPAFTGKTAIEIMGGVMQADPDWTALPATTPSIVRALLRRWSPDGRLILYDDSAGGLSTLPLRGDKKPLALGTRGGGPARFSPDGRWVAYEYTASPDGQRFLVNTVIGAGETGET